MKKTDLSAGTLITTVLIPHSLNHSATACRSAVKHPKTRTGSASRFGRQGVESLQTGFEGSESVRLV